eukprot:6829443-Ditylum_brightwellii.AAC.1
MLTSLEEYVGADFEATVGDEYPTASLAIKEMIAYLQDHKQSLKETRRDLKSQTTVLENFKDAYGNDKDQTMNILKTVIGRLRDVESLKIDLADNFMRKAGLTEEMQDDVEASTMIFYAKVNSLTEGFLWLEKSVAHVSDMMGAYNNPGRTEK